MSKLQVRASLTVHDGKLEEFKQLAKSCMDVVREKDTKTLQYDWFMSEDETLCVVRETYVNSEAVFEHMGNLGELLGHLLSVSDMELEVFGNPSKELREGTAAMNPKIYALLQGL